MKGVDFVFSSRGHGERAGSMQKPNECAMINTRGTAIVLEEAARAGGEKTDLSSSAAIYGDDPTNPRGEYCPAGPEKSVCHKQKMKENGNCRSFTDEGRLATVSLRYLMFLVPYQDPRNEYGAVIPAFIEKAIRNEPITIFGDGRQTRDFIYVKDVIAANEFFG